ncbi:MULTISPECIES: GDYXXLXY domain-containing protein [unclassified Acinetobacter]|uniref:GDYXXLXY domain-containing protein n=1 Tax=unclassified Acinetobacter TaxID=196816 RepID=UPI001C235715|nr:MULTISPECIES: GDYXXLXY domain-containing protein [unclassified Acinetobacter]
MKKFLALHLSIFSIALFMGLILQHEWYLAKSKSIFVELAPVDPRSILQGDYMVLNYQLHFAGVDAAESTVNPASSNISIQDFKDQSEIMSYVRLDVQRRVIRTSFDPRLLQVYPASSSKLLLKNPRNTFEALYPAANSFMFAEGLEPCYRNAKFAELKVKDNGKALLVDLADSQLKPLNCERRKSWRQGS